MWQAEKGLPEDAHILIHGTCEDMTFHSARGFADVIKVMILRWGDYPWLTGWSQHHYMDLHKGKREARRIREGALSPEHRRSDVTAGFEGRRGS